MVKSLNILDFDDTGRAIIEIPKVQHNYSFVLNHWQNIKCQLDEIDDDLSCTMSEEKRQFLEKTRSLLLEYREQLEDDGDKERDEKDIDEFEFGEDKIDDVELKLSNTNSHLNVEYDSEEEEAYLCVYHFRLKHSLAWYLMNRLDHEIMMIEQQIEKISGLLKIYDSDENFEKAVVIIRKSNSFLMARRGLMEEFQLSEIQAEFVISMKFGNFVSFSLNKILHRLEFYATVKSFLNKLKD